MGKIRIYELSRKIKVGNKEIIDELEKRGLRGKTHSSTLDPELVKSLEETFKKRSPKKYAPKKTSTAEKGKKKEKEGKKAKETPSSAKPPVPHVKMKEEKKKTAKKAKKAKPESPAEEADIALPDKLKKEIEEQKDEKLKIKSMQRAFQAIRKI